MGRYKRDDMEKQKKDKRTYGLAVRLNKDEYDKLKLVPGFGITDRIVYLIEFYSLSMTTTTPRLNDTDSSEGDETVSC